MTEDQIDYLDMSLWDVFKAPKEEAFQGRPLLDYFTELERGAVKLGVAGSIKTGRDVVEILDRNVDYAVIGRSAILHHDFARRVVQNPDFEPIELPVSRDYLKREGLGKAFIDYMSGWKGFVSNA